jgi:hypothetical protein
VPVPAAYEVADVVRWWALGIAALSLAATVLVVVTRRAWSETAWAVASFVALPVAVFGPGELGARDVDGWFVVLGASALALAVRNAIAFVRWARVMAIACLLAEIVALPLILVPAV